ncbi:MAG TPA: DUF3597 domain-containing protein, partial [Terrimicrobiaceae bacterium]|nr:DUF3597 domain-containing protein [Terrimicrobiaceae bacterium]
MGLFSNLLSKVFGQQAAATTAAATTPPSQAPGAATPPAPGGSASPAAVDVTAILDDLASKNPEKLDWRRSIVDMMKLVGMDSSLAARKELAKELDYTGDTSDSAKMNIWLHKAVIKKIADNGG